MMPSSPNPLRLARIAAFAALAWTVPSFAADITLTQAMLDDYHINGTVDFSKATIGYGANAVTNNLQPGDTIYIAAHTRKFIRINNVTQGTAANPITITNSGGQFIVAGSGPTDSLGLGFGLSGPQHVILKGTPSPGNYDYGIVIASTKAEATGLQISHTGVYDSNPSSNTFVGPIDVEIAGLEIHDTGFAGIKAKCETGSPGLTPPGYVMDNIRIHDNYIHDTDGEGMYIGWTSAGHEDMSNVLIYDNLLERTGWDGIQLNNAKTGTNAIYGNIILGYGLTSIDYYNDTGYPYEWQSNGFSLGASKLDVHDNYVATVSGTGEEYQGAGLSIQIWDHDRVYNNVFALGQYSAADPCDCMYVNQLSGTPSGTSLDIVNNTVVRPDRTGVVLNDAVTGDINLINNIIAAPALRNASPTRVSDYYDPQASTATVTVSHNLFVSTVAAAGFTDGANNDFTLTSSSSAVDAGTSTSSYGVTADIDGVSRPQGSAYDIGAYERASTGYTIGIVTPTGTGTATGSSYCPATGAFDEQPTWDATNGVPSGLSASPHNSTTTAYANRYFYIDFGPDWAKVRITGMWTRWRPYSAGTYSGFPTMWWDDDKDTTNDGTTATGLNFASGTVTGSSDQWKQDADFTSAPVTPAGRYLMVSTGSSPTDRANEFAFSGYTVP